MSAGSYMSRIFGASPVRPLQEHMQKVMECTDLLVPFLDAVMAEDWDKATELRSRITKAENEADDLKKELRLHLPKSLFMPVPRADILDLLTVQDKIANKVKGASGLITGRRMVVPKQLHDALRTYTDRCLDAARQAHKSVDELDELFETGFRGAEVEVVEAMIEELDRIEKDTDTIQVTVRGRLFEIENDLNPVDVMFLYKVIEWIGDLADNAQRVGSRLQMLLAH